VTWHKPFSEIEVEYIERHYPKMGCADIAAKLGRSEQGVRNVVNRLGLSQPHACVEEAPCARPKVAAGQEEESQDELAELRQLKRALKRSMREDAGPQTLPKLSAEFREVVRRISELEGGDGGKSGGGELAGLIGFVPVRPA